MADRELGMHEEFWHERWAKGEIGFHQPGFNEHMQAFVGHLGAGPGDHFLVPLCGKSLDMLWLAQQGFQVTGIELSEKAARDFFAEQELFFEVASQGEATVYRGENIEIRCDDFFTVMHRNIREVDAVYDRAALIALPREMRPAYASHLASLIGPGIPVLLITLDYPGEEMNGPPFSVSEHEVKELFDEAFLIERVFGEERLSKEPRFIKKGLTRMEENVFILRKLESTEDRTS